jgi:hypothetical protein
MAYISLVNNGPRKGESLERGLQMQRKLRNSLCPPHINEGRNRAAVSRKYNKARYCMGGGKSGARFDSFRLIVIHGEQRLDAIEGSSRIFIQLA